MSPSRWAKLLVRRVTIFSRQQPSRHDIEAMQANIERVGLVIRVRWALVAALAAFSIGAAIAYSTQLPLEALERNMAVPAGALVFVLGYNTFYQLTYRRLGNVAILNHAQLLLDALVVTVLVYYSGGVYSWFHAMYLLFILEAAFILPRTRDTWLVAGGCMAYYTTILVGEYLGALPHIEVPFVDNALHLESVYVVVRLLWGMTVMGGTATVAMLMTEHLRRRETELRRAVVVDELTGLFDRCYFERLLALEVDRAARHGRRFTVLLADINDFDSFNRAFGHAAGDRMLKAVADTLSRALQEGAGTAAVTCRFGGEEFAALLPEVVADDMPGEARRLAEHAREAVAAMRVDDLSVTVSIGLASFPSDATTVEGLLEAADSALSEAAEGGNRVLVAADLRQEAAAGV